MSSYRTLLKNGHKKVTESTVLFCGIVRNCSKNLKNNIHTIEKLGCYFKEYNVVVFENNSKDGTDMVLHRWASKNENVKVFCNDFDESNYNSIEIPKNYSKHFSRRRIQKMVNYRNLYMDYIHHNNLKADYLVVVDLDVEKIDISGVISSFGFQQNWHVIAANSKSYSPRFKRRYHDSYALIPIGCDSIKQSIKSIKENQRIWSGFKKDFPFIKVFSAFGGLSIYKWEAIQNLKYKLIYNNHEGVEVRCEHFSLHSQMKRNGFNNFYLNPNMIIKYQGISLELIKKKLGKHDGI